MDVLSRSGKVLIADPQALAEWCEDREAFAALSALAGESIDEVDLAIEGPDAEAAGREFDRGWHPRFIFDAPTRGEAELRRQFEALVAAKRWDAKLVRLPERVTHPDRVAAALRFGHGVGEVSMTGMLATVAESAAELVAVSAEPMPAGPHSRRWRWMHVQLGPDKPAATVELAGYVTVESGTMVAIDPASLSHWKQLDDTRRALASLESANPPLQELELAGTRCLVWSTTWGDGTFPVLVERDKKGRALRLRVDLGSEQRQQMMHQVWEAAARREKGHLAMVSARVAVDGEPVRWLYREPPDRPEDSGWRIFAGDEDDHFLDDPDNAQLVTLAEVKAMDPTLARVLEASTGAAYERDAPDQTFRPVTDWED